MKKIALLLAVIIGSIILWNYAKPEEINKTINKIGKVATPKKIESQTEVKNYIFVPYWTFKKEISADITNPLIYFGLGVNEDGIDFEDEGYKKLSSFVKYVPKTQEKILAVRMIDKNINAQILKNLSVQGKIASSAVSLAKKYDFNGVLLDYETSAFGFDKTTNNITSFFNLIGNTVTKSGLSFYTSFYGDTFFRARPYDVEKIGKISDKIFVMAYDFSKSRGNPGPNFPLYDNKDYGYDFGRMVDDFQKSVDNSKIVVALGYFGYDWRTDVDGNAQEAGVPMSFSEIEKEFISSCEFKNCILTRTPKSLEPSITYIDESGENHVVWFEDERSIEKKKEALKSKGITQTATWAYSYY